MRLNKNKQPSHIEEVLSALESQTHGATREHLRVITDLPNDVVERRLKELVEQEEVELIKRPGRKGYLYLKKEE